MYKAKKLSHQSMAEHSKTIAMYSTMYMHIDSFF